MKKFLLRNPLRLVLIAAAALSTTACVVEPAYDPYYGYYQPAPTVYVDGYYHSGGYYHHHYHHWHD